MTSTVLVYVTVPDRGEAVRIARAIVTERLAGCANILDGMTSLYHWNGELQESNEAVLLLKTRQELVKSVTDRVCELHPYDVPSILAIPITGGFQPFLNWIAAETERPEMRQV
jgi:periplasmic divalent cation tolerance protein